MLIRIYAITSLLVFAFTTVAGSAIESAMIKSVIIFSVLVILTRISGFLIDIIKENSDSKSGTAASAKQT